jgi:hypothetical protein
MISISHVNGDNWMLSRFPTLICFEGLVRSPLTLTLPIVTALAASARVLKNRDAHSHLSTRICDSLLIINPHEIE